MPHVTLRYPVSLQLHEDTSERVAICKPGRQGSPEASPAGTMIGILDSRTTRKLIHQFKPPNCESHAKAT